LSNRARALLADDHAAILERAAQALGRDHQIVGTVTNGLDALEAAARLLPDVIVLDISMPGMTGLEVASRLRDAGNTAVIVFLTVHEDQEFVDAARATGAAGYVVKSRLASDISKAVAEALLGRPFVSPLR
jgi:DNA-binding NarL/FixJ family response regulator